MWFTVILIGEMFRDGERKLYRDVRSTSIKERGRSIKHRGNKKASSNMRMKSLLMVVVAIGFAFYQLSKTWGRSSLKKKFARSEVNIFFCFVYLLALKPYDSSHTVQQSDRDCTYTSGC